MTKYDAIIIGTGQAGPPLARRLTGAGMKVAIIERKYFGGTCVNTGCVPTKAMVASAYTAHLAQRAADYGVVVDCAASTDMKAVKSRKEIRIGSELLSSDRIFINVGGRAVVPSLPGVNDVPYLTNSSMVDIDFLDRKS